MLPIGPAARLLDRAGSEVAVPVDTWMRETSEGRWLVASLALAPLAPGDYTLALTYGTTTRFVPVRVTP